MISLYWTRLEIQWVIKNMRPRGATMDRTLNGVTVWRILLEVPFDNEILHDCVDTKVLLKVSMVRY